jgi:phage-related protein
MAVFDWAETNATSLSAEARVRTMVLGDGYEQRAPDGLNPVRQTWQLSFEGSDNAAADAMVAFWHTHAGAAAFDWTPLWAATPIRVVCAAWSRAPATADTSDLSATFRQVFEP